MSLGEGRLCQVSGWGYTSATSGKASDTLRSVKLPIISAHRCNSSASYSGHITNNMICAGFNNGGKDACQVRLTTGLQGATKAMRANAARALREKALMEADFFQ